MQILNGRMIQFNGEQVSLPTTIILDSETDEPEIIEMKIVFGEKKSLSLGGIILGTEFMFEEDDGERYMDEWSPTPGTGGCRSLPLLLVNAPPEDHPPMTISKKERLRNLLSQYYESSANSVACIENDYWYTEAEQAKIKNDHDELYAQIVNEFG